MPTCTATTRAGKPCRNPACPGSPFCSAHGGSARPPGAPAGNRNAEKHGFYNADPTAVTIDDAIAGLVDKLDRLDQLTKQITEPDTLLRILELYTNASSRLARMLRDRRALTGEAADGFAGALSQALDELRTELSADL